MTDIERLEGMIGSLQAQVDTQEEMISALTLAYSEVWVTVEMIVHDLLGSRTEEEQRAFLNAWGEARKGMLKDLQKAGEGGGLGKPSSGTRSAVENVVRQHEATPADE